VRYVLNGTAFPSVPLGTLEACAPVGSVNVTSGAVASVFFHLRADGIGAADWVANTAVSGAFTTGGIAASVDHVAAGPDIGSHEIDIVITVPSSITWRPLIQADVGDIAINGVNLSEANIHADTGTITLRTPTLSGASAVDADTGDVVLVATGMRNGTIHAHADTGMIVLKLPAGSSFGYNVTASADTGSANVDIGTTSSKTIHTSGSGETNEQVSAGFASKPVQVSIDASTDTGDVNVEAR
jgi:hypothetical protein